MHPRRLSDVRNPDLHMPPTNDVGIQCTRVVWLLGLLWRSYCERWEVTPRDKTRKLLLFYSTRW
jgi:hypothetical protein